MTCAAGIVTFADLDGRAGRWWLIVVEGKAR